MDADFGLAKWIKAGKLLWIAPGDEAMVLQSLVQGCPYVGLKGRPTEQRIEMGTVW